MMRSVRRLRIIAVSVAILVLVAAAGLAALGSDLGPAVARLMRPLSVPDAPRVRIEVEPGDVTLVAGDDLSITIYHGKDEIEAACRYDHFAQKHFGEYARLNFDGAAYDKWYNETCVAA